MGHHSALRVVISGKKTKDAGRIFRQFENIPYRRISFLHWGFFLGLGTYFFAELLAMTPTKGKKQSIKSNKSARIYHRCM